MQHKHHWVLLIVAGLLLSSRLVAADIVTGLVGWWTFDEGGGTTAEDWSGNGRTGTLTNGPVWATGRVGHGGLLFDAVDDVVTVAAAASINNLTTMTASCWVLPTGAPENNSGNPFYKGSGTVGWQVILESANRQIRFRRRFATTNLTALSTTAAYSASAWSFILVTWDGTTTATNAHIYVDNIEVSYATQTNGVGGTTDDSAATLNIGNSVATDATMNATLDDCRLYNRVLSSIDRAEVFAFTGQRRIKLPVH